MAISSNVSDLLSKLAVGVATATTIAVGGAAISNVRVDAVQDTRLLTLERTSEQMHELSVKLDETNKHVAVLNERLENVKKDK